MYAIKKAKHFREHPGCQFRIDADGELAHFDDETALECGNRHITLHHRMGRGIHLCEEEFFMSGCFPHHDWAEANKRRARELGYILYK